MKGAGPLVASLLAVSAVALTCSSYPKDVALTQGHCASGKNGRSSDKEKFAPRFDGLRFIETLVTAHR